MKTVLCPPSSLLPQLLVSPAAHHHPHIILFLCCFAPYFLFYLILMFVADVLFLQMHNESHQQTQTLTAGRWHILCALSLTTGQEKPCDCFRRNQPTHQPSAVIPQHTHTQTHTNNTVYTVKITILSLYNSHKPHQSLRQSYFHTSAYCKSSKHSSDIVCVHNNGSCG